MIYYVPNIKDGLSESPSLLLPSVESRRLRPLSALLLWSRRLSVPSMCSRPVPGWRRYAPQPPCSPLSADLAVICPLHPRSPCLVLKPASLLLSGPTDLTAGSCHCKQGYGGQQCDRCTFGYSGYPNCIRCNCSLDGSLSKDPCLLPCVCKVGHALILLLLVSLSSLLPLLPHHQNQSIQCQGWTHQRNASRPRRANRSEWPRVLLS